MRIYVNGNETETADGTTVEALVVRKGLNPDTVVVEHNMDILPREMWVEKVLADGDRVEIVAFVGGG